MPWSVYSNWRSWPSNDDDDEKAITISAMPATELKSWASMQSSGVHSLRSYSITMKAISWVMVQYAFFYLSANLWLRPLAWLVAINRPGKAHRPAIQKVAQKNMLGNMPIADSHGFANCSLRYSSCRLMLKTIDVRVWSRLTLQCLSPRIVTNSLLEFPNARAFIDGPCSMQNTAALGPKCLTKNCEDDGRSFIQLVDNIQLNSSWSYL